MDDYQKFIALSRYARWLPKENRRETWEETVTRYIKYWLNKGYIDSHTAIELHDAIEQLEVMPSMRALMTAGEALDRDNVAGFNCLMGDTKILTKEFGLVPIKNMSDIVVNLLDANKNWVPCKIKNYGKDTVSKYTFKLNSNTIRDIYCTPDHNWHLLNGKIKKSHELQQGDKIQFISANRPEINPESQDYKYGVIHGLVYGDGATTYSCNRTKGYHIRLCSDQDELSEWFKGYPVTYPLSANGDPVYMLYDGFAKTHSLKELPPDYETEEYLVGFIRGWLAADGSITKNSQVSICMGADDKDWFKNKAPIFGYVVQREYQQSAKTNYGKRKKGSWVLYLSRSSLSKEDFIIQRKAEKFKELESFWTFSHSDDSSFIDSVYCTEVSTTHSFVINDGLLTGNCSYIAVDRQRAFDEIMYVLMCGCGVGFSCERQCIVNLPVVAEEFHESETTIVIPDSKIGWSTSFRELISLLYNGKIPRWDDSKVRPKGSPLKTFGGRASGPEPLNELFHYCINVFRAAAGRKLTSIEVHGIVCKIAEIVVVGGVEAQAFCIFI